MCQSVGVPRYGRLRWGLSPAAFPAQYDCTAPLQSCRRPYSARWRRVLFSPSASYGIRSLCSLRSYSSQSVKFITTALATVSIKLERTTWRGNNDMRAALSSCPLHRGAHDDAGTGEGERSYLTVGIKAHVEEDIEYWSKRLSLCPKRHWQAQREVLQKLAAARTEN